MINSKKTILLVEDEAIIAITEKKSLEKFGYNVLTANSGEKALDAVEKSPEIDLILMDINLGDGIDGTEAAEIILAKHDLPLIFLSSHTERAVVEKTEGITSYGYVVKSSTNTVLDASIKMAFKLFDSKKKEVEKDLFLKDIIAKNPMSIQVLDKDGFTLEVNPSFKLLFGSVPPPDYSIFNDIQLQQQGTIEILDRLRNGEIIHFPDIYFNVHDSIPSLPDVPVWVHTIGFPLNTNNEKAEKFVLMHENISARRMAEKTLKISELKFSKLFDMNPSACGLSDMESRRYIEVNNAFCSLLGFSKDEVIGKTVFDLDIISPEASKAIFLKADKNGCLNNAEVDLKAKNGDIKYVLLSTSNIEVEGEHFRITVVNDVTDHKLAEYQLQKANEELNASNEEFQQINEEFEAANEELICSQNEIMLRETALRESNELLSLFIKNSPIYAFIKDVTPAESRVLAASENFIEMIGIPGSKMTGRTMDELFPPEFASKITADDWAVASGDITIKLDEDLNGRNYTTIKFPITLGEKKMTAGYTIDITERKQAEETLKARDTRFQLILDATPFPIAIVDLNDDNIIFWSRSAQTLFGHTAPTAAEWYQIAYPDPEYRQDVINRWKPFLDKARSSNAALNTGEYQVTCHDGSVRICELYASFITDNLIVTFNDITERKLAEKALRESEKDLIETQKIAHIGNWRLDVVTNEVVWSEELYRMYGFDPALPPPPYFEHKKLFTDESWELLSSSLSNTRETGIPYELELKTVRKDGRNGWMWVRGETVSDENGQTVGLWGAAQDITARKLAEEEIKHQLAEKTILLKEVHHRIKNNIASIESLLLMQSESISSPEAVSALQDAIGRVSSIRVLYDKLLIGDDYNDTSVKNYTESLIEAIVSLFPSHLKIKIDMHIDDFTLDPKNLFSLGIILNELLTNIMKYAFKGRDSGLINISLSNSNNCITLTLQDNGVGLPDGFDISRSDGFGLTLVTMLSEQLGGVFTIENHNGTKNIVKFDAGIK